MFDIFDKSKDENLTQQEDTLIKITSLLIHAARVDEHYSEKEKMIIIKRQKNKEKLIKRLIK